MRVVGLLGLLAFVGAAPGCGGRTFSCSEDSDCGSDGLCEVSGWCSFSDADCPSGRRFAEHSGDGVGGSCVDAVSTGSTSGTSGPGGVNTSAVTGPSSSSDAVTTEPSSTTDVDSEASTTCPDRLCGTTTSSGTTETTGSTGSSSDETGDPVPPCPGFFDDFDDGAFDPSWAVYGAAGMGGHVMSEEDGELRWDFAAGIVEQRGITRVFDAPLSAIVVHATETSALEGAQAQSVLLFREDGSSGDVILVWSNDAVQLRADGEIVADSATFEWVELRFEAGEVHVSTSPDGTEFSLLTSFAGDYGGGALQSVWLYGQTWTQAPATASAAFGSIRVCEP
ncbi:MAG: hypothetical protein KUG77_17885 [Nannocystaceae bacterium]|nr:hypothetical protein [Nannocystaceae bacterium]